jgi:S1-C subfamily serine protease
MKRFQILFVLAVFLFAGISGASEHSVKEYKDSLVSVKEKDEGSMKGSGFVYSPRGYIVTNNHVVAENRVEQDMEVRFNETGSWAEVRIIGRDPGTDLAALKIDELPKGAESLRISNSTPKEGEEVSLLGNSRRAEGVIVSGEVIELGENITTKEGVKLENSIVVSASIKPGNSGGPILVSTGEVVGVISARDKEEKVGFAIPAYTIRSVIPQLIRNQAAEAE